MRQTPEPAHPSSPASVAALPPPPALPDNAALFLDVDGCLLPFAPRPDAVHVPPALVDRLLALQAQLGGALALVSGRSVATLDELFAPAIFTAAGLHGVERRRAGQALGTRDVPPGLARVRDAAVRLAQDHPGALVEDLSLIHISEPTRPY